MRPFSWPFYSLSGRDPVKVSHFDGRARTLSSEYLASNLLFPLELIGLFEADPKPLWLLYLVCSVEHGTRRRAANCSAIVSRASEATYRCKP